MARATAFSTGESVSKNQRIVFLYLVSSLVFGLFMGLLFPVYASFFVTFKSLASRDVFAAGCVGAGILVGVVSFMIGKGTILSAISRVTCRLTELCEAEGDLSTTIDIRSTDGIGMLVDSFNRFLVKLRGMIGEFGAVAERTQEVGFELAANTTETSAASEQISRHMTTVHDQTEILLDEIANVNAAREAIMASAVVVSDNINRQSDSLTRLSSSIETIVTEFRDISDTTKEQTGTIAASVGESASSLEVIVEGTRKIREISMSVDRIGELTSAISDIAGKISILGLNAAIEAAHAGEAGRGFAVVADEIGKLAELASQNSTRIDEGLGDVVKRVEEGVRHSEDSQASLASLFGRIEGSAALIKEVSEKFTRLAARADAMLTAHNDLVKVTIDVMNSMVSMRNNTGVIESSVSVLQDSSKRYKSAIDEISLGIREIAVDVAHLNKVSGVNAENTESIKAEIGKFRLG